VPPEIANDVKCDAFVTTNPDKLLVLKAADCIPLVFYVPSELLALAHVGRPGAMLHLPQKVINYLDVEPAKLMVYFGPSISTESYKFPVEDFDKTLDSTWKKYVLRRGDFVHIDLRGYVNDELKRCGVPAKNIAIAPEDTGSSKYFSHRRHKLTGEPNGRNAFGIHLL
jgi:copper oxidase (laccase) domain-containing protein